MGGQAFPQKGKSVGGRARRSAGRRAGRREGEPVGGKARRSAGRRAGRWEGALVGGKARRSAGGRAGRREGEPVGGRARRSAVGRAGRPYDEPVDRTASRSAGGRAWRREGLPGGGTPFPGGGKACLAAGGPAWRREGLPGGGRDCLARSQPAPARRSAPARLSGAGPQGVRSNSWSSPSIASLSRLPTSANPHFSRTRREGVCHEGVVARTRRTPGCASAHSTEARVPSVA